MLQNKMLVSIIIPVYNVQEYLEQCLKSVLQQTYTHFEVILIDDGSTDTSGKICDEFARRDKRIRVFHQQNGGQAQARNHALQYVKGDWIAFVDSDDWIEKDMLSTSLCFAIENDLDIVMFSANIIRNGKKSEIAFRYYRATKVIPKEEVVRKLLLDQIGGQMCKAIYKRNCWKNITFPVGRLYEDLAISFRPYLNSESPIGFLDKPLYNYRMNPTSTSFSTCYPYKQYHIFLGFLDHLEYSKQFYCELKGALFEKTVVYALNVVNTYYLSKDERQKEYSDKVIQYLQEHNTEIRNLKWGYHKIMAYLLLRKYLVLYKIILNFKTRIRKNWR